MQPSRCRTITLVEVREGDGVVSERVGGGGVFVVRRGVRGGVRVCDAAKSLSYDNPVVSEGGDGGERMLVERGGRYYVVYPCSLDCFHPAPPPVESPPDHHHQRALPPATNAKGVDVT